METEFEWLDPVTAYAVGASLLLVTLLVLFWLLDWATRDLKKF